jgi:probable blue pigment (indigoidine) exporter
VTFVLPGYWSPGPLLGIATAVSKSTLSAFDPLVLLVVQLSASTVFVTLALLARREPVPRTGQTTRLALLGLLNPGLAYALSLAGLTSISASLSVLLWAGEPLLILVLAVLIFKDRVTPVMAVLMVAAAFTGVLLIIQQRGGGTTPGIALTVAGVACCALYTVLCRRLLLDRRHPARRPGPATGVRCECPSTPSRAEEASADPS